VTPGIEKAITKNTPVSIGLMVGLVVGLIAAGVAWGRLSKDVENKVDRVEFAHMQGTLDVMQSQLDTILDNITVKKEP